MIKSACSILLLSLLFSCVSYDKNENKVSDDSDLANNNVDHQAEMDRVLRNDSILRAATDGVMSFEKKSVKSKADGLEVPVYIFQPLELKGDQAHPALVWVYGGIHDNFSTNYFPFIKEAVEKGFVVIAPEYRGAKGYGEDYYDEFDYGGYEVDDAISAGEYVRENLSQVDPKRIGIIGWSHGGYITCLAVMRDQNLFARAVATVPVTNLIFRLSYKGPAYQQTFVAQKRIGSLPHEKRDLYIERSPYYQVDKLQIPLHIQYATNDNDVDWEEGQMMADALKLRKPNLAEVVIYDNPTNGHYLNRQVNLKTLTRKDDEVQNNSWERIWKFLDQL